MAPYSSFLGRIVTVQYRVGDVLLVASGTFVGDCGRSIFLEQHMEMNGKRNYFRWEIPYPYIHHLEESNTPEVLEAEALQVEPPVQKKFAAAAGSSSTTSSSAAGTGVKGISSLPRPKPI
jgi:hypothetical protein